MKDNWEKVREPLALDENAIREMVKTGFGERVTSSELLGGGLSNSNYKISLEGIDKPIVLRIYSGSAETCQKETEISRLVCCNVPVPEVYKNGIIEEKPFALIE